MLMPRQHIMQVGQKMAITDLNYAIYVCISEVGVMLNFFFTVSHPLSALPAQVLLRSVRGTSSGRTHLHRLFHFIWMAVTRSSWPICSLSGL